MRNCYTVVKLLRYNTIYYPIRRELSDITVTALTELQASYTKLIGNSKFVHARQLDTAKRSRVSIRVTKILARVWDVIDL